MTYTRDAPVHTKSPKHKSPLYHRIILIVAGITVLVFLVAAVAQWITGGATHGDTTPPPASAPADPAQGADGKAPDTTTAVAAAPQSTPTASCGSWTAPPAGDPDLITAPATQWTLVGGMAAPSDPLAGPAFTTPTRHCYAHTPAGALFAISNYLAQAQDPAATPATEIALATQTMVDNPDRAKLMHEWETWVPTTIPPTVVDIRAAFDAFHFIAYSDTLAVIDIASTFNGHLDAGTYTAHYVNGDWLLDPPITANGRWPMRQLPVEDKNYFTHWSAG